MDLERIKTYFQGSATNVKGTRITGYRLQLLFLYHLQHFAGDIARNFSDLLTDGLPMSSANQRRTQRIVIFPFSYSISIGTPVDSITSSTREKFSNRLNAPEKRDFFNCSS